MTLQNNFKNIAIMASGAGSNAEALIKHAILLGHKITCVITDNTNAKIIQRCKRLNTPCYIIPYTTNKIEHESDILLVLREHHIEWILLAGYMRILSSKFLNNFYNSKTKTNTVINIHPSMLPLFPGKSAYEDAFNANVKQSGISIHFVDSGIDTGKIIGQQCFSRYKEDSIEEFKARGLSIEHKIYPAILEKIINNISL